MYVTPQLPDTHFPDLLEGVWKDGDLERMGMGADSLDSGSTWTCCAIPHTCAWCPVHVLRPSYLSSRSELWLRNGANSESKKVLLLLSSGSP